MDPEQIRAAIGGIGMLHTAGFTRAALVYQWLAPAPPGAPAAQGNAIFHAWRDAS